MRGASGSRPQAARGAREAAARAHDALMLRAVLRAKADGVGWRRIVDALDDPFGPPRLRPRFRPEAAVAPVPAAGEGLPARAAGGLDRTRGGAGRRPAEAGR